MNMTARKAPNLSPGNPGRQVSDELPMFVSKKCLESFVSKLELRGVEEAITAALRNAISSMRFFDLNGEDKVTSGALAVAIREVSVPRGIIDELSLYIRSEVAAAVGEV